MKWIKNIIIWSIIAILFQSAVFFAADRYYRTSLLNTKTTEVKIEDKTPAKSINITIPLAATKIEPSFDGQYISYYENNKLSVVNTSNASVETIPTEKNNEQVYSKWLPDINIIILCEKSLDDPTEISIYTYNADTNSKESPTDSSNAAIKLNLNSNRDKISDIEFSTAMNSFYIKALKSNGTSSIFFNDVNGNMSSLITSRKIGTMKTFKNSPGLVYEDLSNGVIRFTNENKSIDNENYCILSTDDNENVYMGVLKNGTVTNILYGSRATSVSQWHQINLENPVNKDDIIITNGGKIYIKYSNNSYVIDEQSSVKTTYSGNLLSITDKEVLSLDNGKLERTTLK